MKLLMHQGFYPPYFEYIYNKHPEAVLSPYEKHISIIMDDHACWTSSLCQYMKKHGINTRFVVCNDEISQKKWALENKFQNYSKMEWEKEIALEQIKRFRPDILWTTYQGDFISQASRYTKKVVTWVGAPLIRKNPIGVSTLITESPYTAQIMGGNYKEVIVTKPGFDSTILKKIGSTKKRYNLTMVGSFSFNHLKRADILHYLLKNGIKINLFGISYQTQFSGQLGHYKQFALSLLKKNKWKSLKKAINQYHKETNYQRNMRIIIPLIKPPVFGIDMYKILAQSHMILNVQIDCAKNHAGNIRIFESTGCGTCLLNENTENIAELFDTQKEIVTFDTKESLLEKIRFLQKHPEKTSAIAKAGQQRILKDHTIKRMFDDIKPALKF